MTAIPAATPHQRLVGSLVAIAIMIAGAVFIVGAALAHVAVCNGYLDNPPRHQMNDLRGGAVDQQLPKCRLK